MRVSTAGCGMSFERRFSAICTKRVLARRWKDYYNTVSRMAAGRTSTAVSVKRPFTYTLRRIDWQQHRYLLRRTMSLRRLASTSKIAVGISPFSLAVSTRL